MLDNWVLINPNASLEDWVLLCLYVYLAYMALRVSFGMMPEKVEMGKKERVIARSLQLLAAFPIFFVFALFSLRIDNFVETGRVEMISLGQKTVIANVINIPTFFISVLSLVLGVAIFVIVVERSDFSWQSLFTLILVLVFSRLLWWLFTAGFKTLADATIEISKTTSWREVFDTLILLE